MSLTNLEGQKVKERRKKKRFNEREELIFAFFFSIDSNYSFVLYRMEFTNQSMTFLLWKS